MTFRFFAKSVLALTFICATNYLIAQGISAIPVGSSYNIYSILLDEQNQVSYDPDLDAVSIVHRQNAGTAGGSGGVSFYRSLDGGANWSGQFIVTPDYNSGTSISSGNRYPSITIYNPPGNTDPANAYSVMVGPSLLPGFVSWGDLFSHSAKLTDGSDVCESYYNTSSSDDDFHPYSLVTNTNGEMWSISTTFTGDVSDYKIYNLNKGIFNPTTKCVDWSVEKQIEPNYTIDFDSSNVTGYGWGIGFGPNGDFGYAVHLSSENSSFYKGIQPIVYKTNDGGNNWWRLPDFDFRTLPAFMTNLTPTSSGETVPFFTSVDVVVDANGKLNIFSEILARRSSNNDSLYFIHTGPGEAGLYALTTKTGADWDAALVDSVMTDDGSIGTVGHSNRAQIARSASGNKVFYTWAKSDASLVSTNDLPNLWMRAKDVSSDVYTDAVNATLGTPNEGLVFYPSIAPIVIETGSNKDYEIATMFAIPGPDDLAPPNYFFLRGVGFDDADFSIPACGSAPELTASVGPTNLDLNWSVVPTSIGCRVQYGRVAGEFSHKVDLASFELSSINVPIGVINPGNYKVKLRCFCSTPDTIASPLSNTVNFSIPALRETDGSQLDGLHGTEFMTQQLSDLSLNPNPASEQTRINFTSVASGEATISVYNLVGVEVASIRTLVIEGSNSFPLATVDFIAGLYLVDIQLGASQLNELLEIIE